MSGTNGYDRNRMTGSSIGGNNNNLGGLSDVAGSQGSAQPQLAAAEGMLMQGQVAGTGGIALHDVNTRSIVAGTVGAGPQVTLGSVFRPPQSISDTGRFTAAYTPASGTTGPHPNLFTSHSAGIGPYNFYSNQYAGYPPGVMPGTLEPHFGSYSAVLQSIGSQAVSQVPLSPFGSVTGGASSITQYPLLTVAQTTSPVPSKTYMPNTEREEMKFRHEQEFDIHRRHSTTGVIKEEKGHHYSSTSDFSEPSRMSVSGTGREPLNQKRELTSGMQDIYKAPAGREGSLKHRILRPSDSSSAVSIGNPQHSAFITTEEPSLKRTKSNNGESDRESCSKGDRDKQGSSGLVAGGNTHLHYPQHFMKGSIIQLANGDLKRVEDLDTNDFVHSADISSDLKIDSSTVVHIEENRAQGTAVLGFVVGEHKVQVTVDATLEHPFFVFGQGWSSCEPSCTSKRYGLDCQQLTVGDVCISLTHKEVTAHAAEISQQQKQQNRQDGNFIFSKEMKQNSSPRASPNLCRNKSPGHAVSPGIYSQIPQGFRSETRQIDTSAKEEHMFAAPTSSQIPNITQAQEQKSRPSPTS